MPGPYSPQAGADEQTLPAIAHIDLDAIAENIRALKKRAGRAQLMAVVKADAYGHGSVEVAMTALREGVTWFGVAQTSEALRLRHQLRSRGVADADAHIFTWLAEPETDWGQLLQAGLEVSAGDLPTLRSIAEAAEAAQTVAPVHLKVDVGMSRGGTRLEQFPDLAAQAAYLEDAGLIRVEGVWSHLSQADNPIGIGGKTTAQQIGLFEQALRQAAEAGLRPRWEHLAATSGLLWHNESRHNMVRVGIGLYGLSPNPAVASAQELGLRPAMTLTCPLISVKSIPAGTRISYGGTWQAFHDQWIGIVPVGYADGLPRAASGSAPVAVGPNHEPSRVLGVICMDQSVIDLGAGAEPTAHVGQNVVIFGEGGPTVEQWAQAAGTINYEIVTHISPTVRRQYHGGK